jgi:hypothetical protein
MTIPVKQPVASDIMESVLLKGDLSKLTPDERVRYYSEVCKSMNLNPLTKPFEYITLNGRLQLYALRSCADQLRKINGVSLEIVSREVERDILTVHVRARLPDGRTDEDLGSVNFPSTLSGEARANAELKAVTKAKRRATLSICGLGWLDETEIEDIPASAKRPARPAPNVMIEHDKAGEIEPPAPSGAAGAPASPTPSTEEAAGDKESEAGVSTREYTELDHMLGAAAKKGTAELEKAWTALEPHEKSMLKAALDRRHKPEARKADEQR